MLKNNFCLLQDYDFYSIPFPLKAVRKRQRFRFINGELEKLHPCYSDDCCFDSYLRFEKSGLKADVVVMQKYKLAEYKQRNGNKPVFVKECQNHPFFISNKSLKFSFWLFLVFLLFIFLVVFSLKLFRAADGQNDFVEPVIIVQEEPVVPVTQLLEIIRKAGGTISCFSWSIDGFTEKVSVQTTGVFPEQLTQDFPGAAFSSVSYKDNKPYVSLELNRKMAVPDDLQNKFDFVPKDFDKLRMELRDFFAQNNIELLEEGVSQFLLKLIVPADIFEKFFDYIAGLDQKRICVSSVLIQGQLQNGGTEGLRIDLCFSKDFYCDYQQLLWTLGKNLSLFYVAKIQEQNVVPKKQTGSYEKKMKVGQILHPDGNVTEFFKDQNGKIFRE